MDCSNFAYHALARQVLTHEFEAFASRCSGGFFRGPAIASGQSIAIVGVQGAAYTLNLDPHQPQGVGGRIDGMPGGPRVWRPNFRDGDGHLDAGLLRWAAGGEYREGPLLLPTPAEWRFLPGVRLRSRRDLAEARILQVRPVALASGGRPEALARVQVVVESRLGQHLLLLPCFDGGVPPGCGRLEPGGRVLLALRRFGIGTAAVTGVLSIDQVGVALNVEQQEAA